MLKNIIIFIILIFRGNLYTIVRSYLDTKITLS